MLTQEEAGLSTQGCGAGLTALPPWQPHTGHHQASAGGGADEQTVARRTPQAARHCERAGGSRSTAAPHGRYVERERRTRYRLLRSSLPRTSWLTATPNTYLPSFCGSGIPTRPDLWVLVPCPSGGYSPDVGQMSEGLIRLEDWLRDNTHSWGQGPRFSSWTLLCGAVRSFPNWLQGQPSRCGRDLKAVIMK